MKFQLLLEKGLHQQFRIFEKSAFLNGYSDKKNILLPRRPLNDSLYEYVFYYFRDLTAFMD